MLPEVASIPCIRGRASTRLSGNIPIESLRALWLPTAGELTKLADLPRLCMGFLNATTVVSSLRSTLASRTDVTVEEKTDLEASATTGGSKSDSEAEAGSQSTIVCCFSTARGGDCSFRRRTGGKNVSWSPISGPADELPVTPFPPSTAVSIFKQFLDTVSGGKLSWRTPAWQRAGAFAAKGGLSNDDAAANAAVFCRCRL